MKAGMDLNALAAEITRQAQAARDFKAPTILGPKPGERKAMKVDLKQAAAVLGARGGQAKTPRKQAAARANGKKGGRPRKENGHDQALQAD